MVIAPNASIVAILEQALADARSGRTTAIAFVQIGQIDGPDGHREWLTSHAWADGEIEIADKLLRAIAVGFDRVEEDLRKERDAKPAGIDDAIWQSLKADYLRLESPSWAACYWRARQVAEARGLALPSSTTLHRRLKREVPASVIVLRRQGAGALIQ